MKRLMLGSVRRALVVAPHPDDEAIGAWGVIRQLRRQGVAVRIVIVADGAASHLNSQRWPKRRLVAERQRETRRAMRSIGVSAGECHFLKLPDGGVACHPPQSVARAVTCARPDVIFLPAADDAHPDHRAVATAARSARSSGARRLSYGVWPAGRCRGAALRWPLAGMQAAKRAAIARYRTQMGAIRDDPNGFAIARHELHAFSRPCEHFRVVRR